jgi:hypothetical protein
MQQKPKPKQKKEEEVPPERPPRPFKINDLNLWRRLRPKKRMILTAIGLILVVIPLYYFGTSMNSVSQDCYYVVKQLN